MSAAVTGGAVCTLKELKLAVMLSDETPGDLPAADVEHVVGIVAFVLGLAALSKGIAVDLGNGYVLCCTTQSKEASCAG